MTTECHREAKGLRKLPHPHDRVHVRFSVGEYPGFRLEAWGAPQDLVAAGLARPEWVPAAKKGRRKPPAPDGSSWAWLSRGPSLKEWRISYRTKSLEVAKRWPWAPADFAVPEPKRTSHSPLHLEGMYEQAIIKLGEVRTRIEAIFEQLPGDSRAALSSIDYATHRIQEDCGEALKSVDSDRREVPQAKARLRLVVDNTR